LQVEIKITVILSGKEYTDELKFVPLSNDITSKRIRDLVMMCERLLEFKESPRVTIQLGE
jgi:hypothetical protein